MDGLFKCVVLVDCLNPMDTAAKLPTRPKLQQYLNHCCKQRTYSGSILKCRKDTCQICKPPRLHPNDFRNLDHLPWPHAKRWWPPLQTFTEVLGTDTDEKSMPSHRMPFNPVKQHAINTSVVLVCAECKKPRLVYSAKKYHHSKEKLFSLLWLICLFDVGQIWLNLEIPMILCVELLAMQCWKTCIWESTWTVWLLLNRCTTHAIMFVTSDSLFVHSWSR